MNTGKKILIGAIVLIIAFFGLIISGISYYYYDTYRYDTYRENRAPLVSKPLPQQNPTSYTFEGTPEQLHKKIISGFENRSSNVFPLKTYYEYGDTKEETNAYFYVCTKDADGCLGINDKEEEEIFNDPQNQNDIYLANDGSGMVSHTYYALGKPLDYLADFHIHLQAEENDKTKITITPIKTMVHKGYEGRGMHGGLLPKKVPVEATTVEEYQLLYYIGFVLGEKDMPQVIFPK
jgi:hypothetical protein